MTGTANDTAPRLLARKRSPFGAISFYVNICRYREFMDMRSVGDKKLTAERKKKVKAEALEARELGMSFELCARRAGISIGTLNNLRGEDDEFELKLQEAQGLGIYKAVKRLTFVATSPTIGSLTAQVEALRLLLPAIAPEMFSPTQRNLNRLTINQFFAEQPERVRKRVIDVISNRDASDK